MLDSLVRVSRRVGKWTDRFATDAECAARDTRPLTRPRSEGTGDSPLKSDDRPRDEARRRPRKSRPRSARRANANRVYNTDAEAPATFPECF